MDIFRFLTPISYWLLAIFWTAILCFYLRRLTSNRLKNKLFVTLILILAIDAFRTLFESIYFGAWYTSLVGLIPRAIHDFLIQPQFVIIPKAINVVAAVLVIVILLRRWLPQEEEEQIRQRNYTNELEQQMAQCRRIQNELRQNEEQYRNLYNTPLVGLFRTAMADGMIINANLKMAEMLGYASVHQLLKENRKAAEFYPPGRREEFVRLLEKNGEVSDFEINISFSDGGEANTLIAAKIYPDRGYIEGAAIDISDRKRAEIAQNESEKLQGVLEMAGAVCHELNQPLQSITGYSELVLLDTPKDNEQYPSIKAVVDQSRRMANVMRKLMTITRYRTKDYLSGKKIIDIEKSSQQKVN